MIELCFDPFETLVHVGPELADSLVQIADSQIQIVEAIVLHPGGKHERNYDGQGDLNERLLEYVYRHHIFSFARTLLLQLYRSDAGANFETRLTATLLAKRPSGTNFQSRTRV